jgi:hypothetical protein
MHDDDLRPAAGILFASLTVGLFVGLITFLFWVFTS